MKFARFYLLSHILVVLILIPSLTGCTPSERNTTPTKEVVPTKTEIPITPTATSEPMAARVNGEGISLTFFEGEVARYKLALTSAEMTLPPEEEIRTIVINDLIGQVLMKQGAEAGGKVVSDQDYQQEVATLITELGGEGPLNTWMAEKGYDQVQFETALRLSIAVGWQKNQIIASVPDEVEQVHVQQIFAYTPEGAERALTSINSGTDFDQVAWIYDPVTGGDLSWFPRGYLTVEEVDVAAFSLAVGEYSQIIQTSLGYHIIKVLEKDSAYPLTIDAKLFLQKEAVAAWLKISREQAEIVINI
jgi:peptidyl-prolyl cis-trans isomerase C